MSPCASGGRGPHGEGRSPAKAVVIVGVLGVAERGTAVALGVPRPLQGSSFSSFPLRAVGGRPAGKAPGRSAGWSLARAASKRHGDDSTRATIDFTGTCVGGGFPRNDVAEALGDRGAWRLVVLDSIRFALGDRSRSGQRGAGLSIRAKSASPRSGVSLLAEAPPGLGEGPECWSILGGGAGGSLEELNQVEERIFSRLGRDFGSVRRMVAISSLAGPEIWTLSGNAYWLWRIRRYVVFRSDVSKGGLPTSMVYRTTPRDQMSTS